MGRAIFPILALVSAATVAMVTSSLAHGLGVPLDMVRTDALGVAGLIFASLVFGSFVKRKGYEPPPQGSRKKALTVVEALLSCNPAQMRRTRGGLRFSNLNNAYRTVEPLVPRL
jgi:hypothetical protein